MSSEINLVHPQAHTCPHACVCPHIANMHTCENGKGGCRDGLGGSELWLCFAEDLGSVPTTHRAAPN